MSQEKILDALEFIDDDMIEVVNVLRKYPERHKFLWVNYLAVAACVMLAIFGGFTLFDGDYKVPSAENSAAGDSADIADNVNQYADDSENKNETVNDNSSFRDEFSGGTNSSSGDTSSGSTGSSVSSSFTYHPIYMEITEVSKNSFKGRVINRVVVEDCVHFEENQVITVIYREDLYADYDTLLIEDLKVGEKVYVIYGKPDSKTIYTSYIRYDRNF